MKQIKNSRTCNQYHSVVRLCSNRLGAQSSILLQVLLVLVQLSRWHYFYYLRSLLSSQWSWLRSFASSLTLLYPTFLRSYFFCHFSEFHSLLYHVYRRTEYQNYADLQFEKRKQLSIMEYSNEVATQVKRLVKNCQKWEEKTKTPYQSK